MAEHAQIERLTREIVDANTAPGSVVSVSARDSLDWTGDPIVKVSIVISDESARKLRNKVPLDILSQLMNGLQAAGETRFPILDYATPAELSAEVSATSDHGDY
ncbi:hypothetical protein FNL55_01060 [Tardiphaga sp. vice352]|uniref:hypothetical protein n=1 Tax=unclassified Tardiphaga TaxID=2631404 RepID=UPI001163CF19|nr:MULTISPECIES: hypothetical protein [unclassified Tardiphaga]MBC7586544.1 hypothetical protein [Tardiphaga sp.]QDM14702.1 hypothetical protein FNL53_01065 [Tardiphaga sp. vice278]QDM19861.1 hypothetical protein FIU28_00865 [Tardiphaga sp. vice154]QDM24881.1 hypothetical protein FNL56_00965 [Tardiphaga sp. vice304]QDM30091.1 hypothetical protein FNL55_01060 [Tardiphaga sp. vice352]